MGNYPASKLLLIFFASVYGIFYSCSEAPEPDFETTVEGTVKDFKSQESVYSAYIIYNDELLAITDENGNFETTPFKAGSYSFLCSALNFADKVVQVVVDDNAILNCDIYLTPDESKGELIGEFQDKLLLAESFIKNPEKTAWDEEQIHDGLSGATIQVKNKSVPNVLSRVFLADSMLAEADEYGQYWFELQSGTYPLRIFSEGYEDQYRIIRIATDSLLFVNFVLERK